MQIAVILQYYHTPDCPTAARPYALVERLGRDHDVTVITTRAWEKKRRDDRFPWSPSGVELVRLDVPYDNSMSASQRLSSFVHYATRAVKRGLTISRPDIVIGSSTPLTAAAAAGTIAELRSLPWIFEVRDLWPDFPIQMGAVPDFGLHRLLYAGERTLYQRADQVVTLSPDMERHVRDRAPSARVETLPYGSDFELIDAVTDGDREALRRDFTLDDHFLVLYAGTFGRANAVPTMLEAARELSSEGNVLFAFAGRGHHETTVRETAQQHDAIQLIPPLSYPEALALFSMADLSLVPFLDRPVLAANAPGKFFDSLSTGTPVVVTNPGWTKRFVERHECGWYVPPESPARLANRIRTLLETPDALTTAGDNARTAAEWFFRRSDVLDRYAELVERVAARSRR